MSKKFFLFVAIAAIASFAAGSLVFSQYAEEEMPEVVKYTVVKGKGSVEVNGVKYPIYKGIKEVEANQFGGLYYAISKPDEKQANTLAKNIMKFYKGKKIVAGKAKLKAFKNIGKPDTTAWDSCGPAGFVVVEIVENWVDDVKENIVEVDLFAECNKDLEAFIL